MFVFCVLIAIASALISLFLNQASAGHRPVHTWFLKIVSVRMSACVCVCMCVCVCLRACLRVCVSAPEAINN